MEDLMQKIQQILNDPEAMKQVNELASSMTPPQNSQPQPAQPSFQPQPPPQPQTSQPDLSMLASLLSGPSQNNGSNNYSSAGNQGLDISKLMMLQGVMEKAGRNDRNVDLLIALRPLLKNENQVKLDKLIKIFRLMSVYPVLKESGLLGGDLLGIL